jgi:hypothetical protein
MAISSIGHESLDLLRAGHARASRLEHTMETWMRYDAGSAPPSAVALARLARDIARTAMGHAMEAIANWILSGFYDIATAMVTSCCPLARYSVRVREIRMIRPRPGSGDAPTTQRRCVLFGRIEIPPPRASDLAASRGKSKRAGERAPSTGSVPTFTRPSRR